MGLTIIEVQLLLNSKNVTAHMMLPEMDFTAFDFIIRINGKIS